MSPAENIEKLIKNVKIDTNAGTDEAVLEDILKALENHKKQKSAKPAPNIWRIIMKTKTVKLTTAAVIIIAVLIGINQFGGNGNAAIAQVLEQIEKANAITWKTTFYTRVTSKDQKSRWIETETREIAYKAPGLYREVMLDKNMQIKCVTITDTVNLRELSLNPGEKKATLSELALATHDSRGAFFWEKEYIKEKNLEWVGKRKTTTGEVNIFRSAFRDKANNEDWSYDFWIDAETKQLIAVQVPGADIYDPEKDPIRNNPHGKSWFRKEPICHIKHDINLDAELEESLFQTEPPQDYMVTNMDRSQVTEEDMVDFLGILAEYYNESFPDQVFPFAVTGDELNKIEEKAKSDRTAIEQELLETITYYKSAGLNMLPIAHFVEDHTIEKSFRYLGKGAKLGDKDRIVCWYKPKGSNTYRAVYGDLSVKDVEPEGLPLRVEP